MASIPRAAALRVARVVSLGARPQFAAIRPISVLRTAAPIYSCRGKGNGQLQTTASNPLGSVGRRWFSSEQQGLTEEELKDRVLQILKQFDKVNPEKVMEETMQ